MVRRLVVVAGILLVVLVGGSSLADDYSDVDADLPPTGTWVHKHSNYPPKPSGLAQINNVFGKVDGSTNPPTCQPRHSAEDMTWKVADYPNPAPQEKYAIRFHNKLGGDVSSNLDWDVKGHIKANGLNGKIKHGVWGQVCRFISGTNKVSTHAWGIAVDQNSFYEHYGHSHCHTVSTSVADVWKNHNWKWGKSFKDCMHFQYATRY